MVVVVAASSRRLRVQVQDDGLVAGTSDPRSGAVASASAVDQVATAANVIWHVLDGFEEAAQVGRELVGDNGAREAEVKHALHAGGRHLFSERAT